MHSETSQSCAKRRCFAHFHLQMCFSLQRCAILPHLNFKKWSVPLSFLTFWLQNVLLATAARNFSTSQLQKVVRPAVFVHFDFKMCFSLQRRAIFPHRNFKKWSEPAVFCAFWLQNVLLPTAACNVSKSELQKVVRTRRFTEVTFRPSPPTNHWKTQHLATSLTFRACGSSFDWLSRNCIFFLLTLLLFSAFSSSDSAALLCSAFSTVHIVGS